MEDRAVARAEADALELRCQSYTAENESLKHELDHLKNRLLESELAFARTDAGIHIPRYLLDYIFIFLHSLFFVFS